MRVGRGVVYAGFMVTLALLAGLALACPSTPLLRDQDGVVTALSQNLKFITTGGWRAERSELLAGWLHGEGGDVDLLLLSEARLLEPLRSALPDFCFYTQAARGRDTYAWEPLGERPPPGGLALAVRVRADGEPHMLGAAAGRPFRARPTTWAENLLGRIFRYTKGWAQVTVDGTTLAWSHMQASYPRRPEVGAGEAGRGRAGQFDDLARDLGRRANPTLLTGDLNLLEGFDAGDARVAAARERDERTLASFEARTGVEFHAARAPRGTFLGSLFHHRGEEAWDRGATYDRVGTNRPFALRHPDTEVRVVEIVRNGLRVSDHLGLEIRIPFRRP